MNVIKLGPVAGNKNFFNEVICSKLKNSEIHPGSVTVFFGGDVQDYPEVMSSHRDNGQYLQWNLLNIVTLLSLKFPSSTVCVIKPKRHINPFTRMVADLTIQFPEKLVLMRMEFKTFSCYDNFVLSNDLGAPNFTEMNGALSHLRNLISNTLKKLSTYESDNCLVKEKTCEGIEDEEILYDTINLIGFSKGCVVLNQLITEVHTIYANSSEENEDLKKFWSKVRSIYWLDGGHSGGKNTWINKRSILNTLATFPSLSIHVHVTPYQVRDERRPWIGKECKNFVDILKKAKSDIHYKLHFEDNVPSLVNHFKVLDAFK